MATITRGKVTRGDLANWDGKNSTTSRPDATGGTVTGLAVGHAVDVLQVYGEGTNRTRGTISNAVQRIGSTDASLQFSVGTWTIDADFTIPSNFTLILPAGCLINVQDGFTLTIAGKIKADRPEDIYSGAGTVEISDKGGHFGTWFETADEISADVTIVDFHQQPGRVLRYGENKTPGTTDMTTAVQAWLDVGGNLTGEKQEFRVTSSLQIKSGTVLDGRGMKIVHDTDEFDAVLTGDEVENVVIRNLEIDGRGDLKTSTEITGASGIRFIASKKVWILYCYIHDCDEHGISVTTISSEDTEFENNDILIHGNLITDNGNDDNDRGRGIFLFGLVRRAIVSNNFILDNYDGGIHVDDTSSSGTEDRDSFRIVISGNIVLAPSTYGEFSSAIGSAGTRGITITGNVVSNYRDGITCRAVQSTTETGRGVISNNRVNARRYGVLVTDAVQLSVSDNIIYLDPANLGVPSVEALVVGVELESLSGPVLENVKVSGNIVESSQHGIRHGYVGVATSEGLIIDHNQVIYIGADNSVADQSGIQVQNVTGLVIDGNHVEGFHDGIFTNLGSSPHDIKNNISINNDQWGISTNTLQPHYITGNRTGGNGTAGLRLTSASDHYQTYILHNIMPDGITGDFTLTTRENNVGIGTTRAAGSSIADVAAVVNTEGKYEGKLVWEDSNNRMMRAEGAAAADPWRALNDPTIVVTPA